MTPKIISHTTILKKILTPHHNVIFEIKNEDQQSISIKQTKTLIQKINFSSKSSKIIETFLIYHAHTLTLAAQNNLLKTLEETPTNKQIILITPSPHTLLSTITSRCRLYQDKYTKISPKDKVFLPPLSNWKNTPGQIPDLVDQILKNNPLDYLASALHQIKPTNSSKIKALKHLHNCLFDLNRNINPKLALDHFFLIINS